MERGGNSEPSKFNARASEWLQFAPPFGGAPAKRVRGSPLSSRTPRAPTVIPAPPPSFPRPHRHSRAPSVIPAPPPSFPRRRESIQDQHQLPESQSSSRVSLRHGPAGPSAVRVRVSNQAQTKIHGQGAMQRPTRWIPACAGMTERRPTTTDHSQPHPTTPPTTKPSNSRHITPIFPTPRPGKNFRPTTNHPVISALPPRQRGQRGVPSATTRRVGAAAPLQPSAASPRGGQRGSPFSRRATASPRGGQRGTTLC